MEPYLIIFNMSGIYDRQDFYEKYSVTRLDLRDLPGTNGYLDDAAADHIRELLSAHPVNSLCFIDNGNYHYLSKLRLEQIRVPFDLVVFDHHSDMEEPSFGEILSCGSWILFALKENPFLRKVVLLGPDEEQIRLGLTPYLAAHPKDQDRILVICDEELVNKDCRQEIAGFLSPEKEGAKEGIFISIDKDVLSPSEVMTNWDQGDMAFETMERVLGAFQGKRILGADICGEGAANDEKLSEEEIRKSSLVNERLIAIFKGLLYT